jgi:hypothetical protein
LVQAFVDGEDCTVGSCVGVGIGLTRGHVSVVLKHRPSQLQTQFMTTAVRMATSLEQDLSPKKALLDQIADFRRINLGRASRKYMVIKDL